MEDSISQYNLDKRSQSKHGEGIPERIFKIDLMILKKSKKEKEQQNYYHGKC